MKLLIVSNMAHYRRNGRVVCAWPAAAGELDALAREFDETTHICCLHPGEAPAQATTYRENIRLESQAPAGGKGVRAKLAVLAHCPRWWRVIRRELHSTDAVQVRCPAGVGAVALLALAMSRRPALRWVKYAGEWRPARREPLSYRLQRLWLRLNASRAWVAINDSSETERRHVRTLANPCFSRAELAEALAATQSKRLTSPLRLAFVGRVEEDKGCARVIDIVTRAAQRGVRLKLEVAGDGPARRRLADLARLRGLGQCVTFHGWLSRDELDALYRRSHLILLPSRTEGWPKVLAEAMARRCVPLASDVGAIRTTLGRAGIALDWHDIPGWADALAELAESPGRWRALADEAAAKAAEFTYERYVREVLRMLGMAQRRKARPRAAEVAA